MHHLARLPFIDAGELVLTLGEPLATVHRYAMLHATKAALVLHGISAERHTAVRIMFRRHLVEAGLVESEWADAIALGSDERIQSDYDIDAVFGETDARQACEHAEAFLNRIRALVAGVAPSEDLGDP